MYSVYVEYNLKVSAHLGIVYVHCTKEKFDRVKWLKMWQFTKYSNELLKMYFLVRLEKY